MGENREALNALDRALGLQGNITSPKKSENTDENQTSPKPESNFLKNYIKALYIKGKVLLQSGETSEAIKSLTLASQHDPNNIVNSLFYKKFFKIIFYFYKLIRKSKKSLLKHKLNTNNNMKMRSNYIKK